MRQQNPDGFTIVSEPPIVNACRCGNYGGSVGKTLPSISSIEVGTIIKCQTCQRRWVLKYSDSQRDGGKYWSAYTAPSGNWMDR